MERITNLDLILAATGGALIVTLPILAQLTPWSEKTLRNRPDAFPLPLRHIGNRVGVPAIELAAYLDGLSTETGLAEPASQQPQRPLLFAVAKAKQPLVKRGRGRPRKVAKLAAYLDGLSTETGLAEPASQQPQQPLPPAVAEAKQPLVKRGRGRPRKVANREVTQ